MKWWTKSLTQKKTSEKNITSSADWLAVFECPAQILKLQYCCLLYCPKWSRRKWRPLATGAIFLWKKCVRHKKKRHLISTTVNCTRNIKNIRTIKKVPSNNFFVFFDENLWKKSKPISLEFGELRSLFFWSPGTCRLRIISDLRVCTTNWLYGTLEWDFFNGNCHEGLAICWQQFWGSLHPGITWDSGRPSEWIWGYETQLASHLRMIFKSLSMPSSWNSEQMGIKDQGFITVSVVPSLPTTNHQRPCLVLPFAAEVHAFWRHYSQRNSRPSGDNCWAEMTFSTGKMAVELFNSKQRSVDRFSCNIRMHWMQTLKDEGCLL